MMAQAARDLAGVETRCLCHEAREAAGTRQIIGDGTRALPASGKADERGISREAG
jgi:hypothetical protein